MSAGWMLAISLLLFSPAQGAFWENRQEWTLTLEERQDVVMENICNLWQGRISMVQEAWKEVEANNGICLAERRMDHHSTNKRDARIREVYGRLNDLAYFKNARLKPKDGGAVCQ